MESSPFVQAVTAGLWHILTILLRKNRKVTLYLTERKDGEVQNHGETYKGEVKLRSLSVTDYSLVDETKLQELLQKIVSVVDFIAKESCERDKCKALKRI